MPSFEPASIYVRTYGEPSVDLLLPVTYLDILIAILHPPVVKDGSFRQLLSGVV